jgi:hypothetical protein
MTTAGARAGGLSSVEPEWSGETAFLVCGGSSVKLADLDTLRGRRVVVVNSSVYRVPWADILFFGDERWELENRHAVKAFRGRVISASYGDVHCSYIEFLRRPRPAETPAGLSGDRASVWLRHTSVRGAINLLCHLGVKRIVTLGLDGGPDAAGQTHHHAPHPWALNKDIWALQREELAAVTPALAARGVDLFNASPGSKILFWPIVSLADYLASESEPA